MRIMVLVEHLSNGGTERVITQLSLIWAKLGHETVFVTKERRKGREFPNSCIAHECYDGRDLRIEDVLAYCDKYRPDCFVLNGGFSRVDAAVSLEALKQRPEIKKIAIIHHSYSTWLYELACSEDFSRKQVLLGQDVLVCVDPLQALWWREMGAKVIYIPNPVGVTVGVDTEAQRRGETKRIVWIGRLVDECKCADKAIGIFRRVREHFPDTTMTMLGKVDEKTRVRLLRDVPEYVRMAIKMPGFTSDVTAAVRESAIHLFTSELEVTVPQVILEAQACGTPTFAIDMPPLAPVSEEQGVVKAENEASLADRICEAFADSKQYETLVAASSEAGRIDLNGKVQEAWAGLFAALSDDAKLDACREENIGEIATTDNYRLILKEEQRAQERFIKKHLEDLTRMKIWKGRLSRIMAMFGGAK